MLDSKADSSRRAGESRYSGVLESLLEKEQPPRGKGTTPATGPHSISLILTMRTLGCGNHGVVLGVSQGLNIRIFSTGDGCSSCP